MAPDSNVMQKTRRTQPWAPGSQSGEMLWRTSGNFAAREKRTAMTTSAWGVPEEPRPDFRLMQEN